MDECEWERRVRREVERCFCESLLVSGSAREGRMGGMGAWGFRWGIEAHTGNCSTDDRCCFYERVPVGVHPFC